MIKIYCTVFTIVLLTIGCAKDGSSDSAQASGTAKNGSLTRFITVGNYLYIVKTNSLVTYNISNPQSISVAGTQDVGFDIQTIFEYNNQLFIGSNTAMYIYGLTNPAQPEKLTQVNYFQPGRDPIVARDSVAYATQRVGTVGTLNVVNIKNLQEARIVNALPIATPYGLALGTNTLYVCNGSNGLAVINVSSPYQPVMNGNKNFDEVFYDAILQGNILICYVKGGIVLLDVSTAATPLLITKIKQ